MYKLTEKVNAKAGIQGILDQGQAECMRGLPSSMIFIAFEHSIIPTFRYSNIWNFWRVQNEILLFPGLYGSLDLDGVWDVDP